MKLKKGDTVLIITGKDKGKTGVIEAVMPSLNRIVVTGINAYKKHTKPSARNPQGGIIEAFRSIHASNAMILDENKKPSRVGFTIESKEKSRIARTTQKSVGK